MTRLRSGVVQLPSAMALGAAHDPSLTRSAWAAAGNDLGSIGLTADFAPDADVLADAGNTVIGSRSFGGIAADVSAQVGAAVSGLRSAGLATAIKHFPGHGDTDVDSHKALPVLSQSLAQLTSVDLAPFRAGIAAGTDMVMVGHLDVRSSRPGSAGDVLGQGDQRAAPVPARVPGRRHHRRAEHGAGDATMVGGRGGRAGDPGRRRHAADAGESRRRRSADCWRRCESGRLPRSHLVAAVTRILTLKFRLAANAKIPSGGNRRLRRRAVDRPVRRRPPRSPSCPARATDRWCPGRSA